MSESTMVERVARAIWKGLNRGIPGEYVDFDGLPDPQRAMLLATARAAIEAMREPTPRMVSAGESAASIGIGRPVDDEAVPRVWREMLSAALQE